ncbi:MAG TPA: hypothetical protein VMU05_05760 [Dongiaceae bacterium]|nr:hypothetical protein [Dongiaceae bacterium]
MRYARMFALALTFMPLLAAAQFNGRNKIVTKVPFEFRVGDKVFPAGECTIEPALYDGSAVFIRNVRAKTSVASATNLKDLAVAGDHFALVFHKYGNRYFLSGIKVAGMRRMYRLPESRGEAELRAENQPAAEEVLLAAE